MLKTNLNKSAKRGRSTRVAAVSAAVAMLAVLAGCGQPGTPGAADTGRVQLREHENYHDFGDYVVHVNALTTDQLSAEVARLYGITRSGKRALLNVTVLKKTEGELDRPVNATIGVSAANLTGQNKGMEIRRITDGDSIYYIGETSVNQGEVLVFDLNIQPDQRPEEFLLRFRKEFFGN